MSSPKFSLSRPGRWGGYRFLPQSTHGIGDSPSTLKWKKLTVKIQVNFSGIIHKGIAGLFYSRAKMIIKESHISTCQTEQKHLNWRQKHNRVGLFCQKIKCASFMMRVFGKVNSVSLPTATSMSVFLKSAERMFERQLMAIWMVSSWLNVDEFFFSFFSSQELASVCLAPTEQACSEEKNV